jgi:Tol biopolymer transport system component/regulation of enolase protein 1 (concanavalin A-like superfamily)
MKKFTCACFILSLGAKLALGDSTLGVFSDQSDVGVTAMPGSATYDPSTGSYLISGGGANMWSTNDAFHFVWVKMSGDFTLAADIKFQGTSAQPHRKACLVIRQSLASDSPYTDVALHGNGLTALQSRETAGATTYEIQSDVSGPARVRLEKHGDYIYMSVAPAGQELQPAGAMYHTSFQEPFYVGLAVCAHDNTKIERAVFSNVELKSIPPVTTNGAAMESTLETMEIASTDRQVVYHTTDHIEAPNWSRDGSYFLFNSKGRIWKLPTNGTPEVLDTGSQTNCNNDHVLSPDGKWLAISDQTQDGKSRVYVLPSSGGQPHLMTELAPSYMHGWSPNGKTLAYCAERNGNFDVYSIPAKGGKEKRLTTAEDLDDGPDYSPDGKYIYFNSERTGLMQIWRMKPDGSDQEQITTDDYNNWFAHPSPDGHWIIFLTYNKDVKGHPPGQDVMLRLMSLSDHHIQTLAKPYGGQGTINVPSWSPDSRNVAFVSYQWLYP